MIFYIGSNIADYVNSNILRENDRMEFGRYHTSDFISGKVELPLIVNDDPSTGITDVVISDKIEDIINLDWVHHIEVVEPSVDTRACPANDKTWSEKEVAALTTLYPFYGSAEITQVLISRSWDSISKKARTLGLTRDKENADFSKTLEYISTKINIVDVYELSNIHDVIRLAKTDAEFSTVDMDNIAPSLMRYVCRMHSLENIHKYRECFFFNDLAVCFYCAGVYGRMDILEKVDGYVVDKFWRLFSYDNTHPDGGYFIDQDTRWINTLSTIFARNPKNAMNNIKTLFGSEASYFTNPKVVYEARGKYISDKLIEYMDDDQFNEYVLMVSDDIPLLDNSFIEYAISRELNNDAFNALLVNLIFAGNTKMIEKLVSVTNKKLVFDESLTMVLAQSIYYTRILQAFPYTLDLDLKTMIHVLINSAIVNNDILVKRILNNKNEAINPCFYKIMINHFENHGNKNMVKFCDEKMSEDYPKVDHSDICE